MGSPDPDQSKRLKGNSRWFALLAIVFFITCFVPLPLGNFFILISIGATLYFVFLTIYYLVLAEKAKYPFRKKKLTSQDIETREYVKAHLPIAISILLGGLLIALTIWLFFT